MDNNQSPNNMKKIRKEKHITQKELAEKTGIGQDRISRYEQGQSMSVETMKKIVEALETSADYFLGLIDK